MTIVILKRLVLVGLVTVVASVVAAQDVFTSGLEFVDNDFRTHLNEFKLDGSLIERTAYPNESLTSLTTDGTRIIAGSIDRVLEFDLEGNYLGVIATLSGGYGALVPYVDTDVHGNVYVAYGGFSSFQRTSFRLSPSGTTTQTFSHPDLVFPVGIDATEDGMTWIMNGAGVGVGNRLFAFDAGGAFLSDFAIPEVGIVSTFTISDSLSELYITDFDSNEIHIYDISSGAPVFDKSLSTPNQPQGIFIESNTNRIFGTSSGKGFEIDRDGNVINEYLFVGSQSTSAADIVAFVPEPGSFGLIMLTGLMAISIWRRR